MRRRVVQWLDSVFKSSTDGERIFALETLGKLEDGSSFTHLAVLHGFTSGIDSEHLVRRIGLYFCNGDEGREVLGTKATVFFMGEYPYWIIESTRTATGTRNRHHLFGHSDRMQFDAAFERLSSHLLPVLGNFGTPLPKEHFLLRQDDLEVFVMRSK